MTFLEAQAILSKIKYKRARFYLSAHFASDEVLLTIKLPVPHIETGMVGPITSTTILYLEAMDEKAFVHYIYHKCVEIETHEVGEWFSYDGERRYDPHLKEPGHKPIQKLAEFPDYDTRPKLEIRSTPNASSPLYDAFSSTMYRDRVAQYITADGSTSLNTEEPSSTFQRIWKKFFK